MTAWNTDFSATWRHFDKVNIDSSSGDPQLNGAFNPVNGTLGSRDYFDLAASWNATKQITIWGGVNNIFDRDPADRGLRDCRPPVRKRQHVSPGLRFTRAEDLHQLAVQVLTRSQHHVSINDGEPRLAVVFFGP